MTTEQIPGSVPETPNSPRAYVLMAKTHKGFHSFGIFLSEKMAIACAREIPNVEGQITDKFALALPFNSDEVAEELSTPGGLIKFGPAPEQEAPSAQATAEQSTIGASHCRAEHLTKRSAV